MLPISKRILVAAGVVALSLLPLSAEASVVSTGGWTPSVFPSHGVNTVTNTSVSCVSPTSCVTAGAQTIFPAEVPAVQSGTPGHWTLTTLPTPTAYRASPITASLASISCTSNGNCVAVGTYGTTGSASLSMIETRTAGKWHVTGVALPSNISQTSKTLRLTSVSCPTATACFAAGFYSTASGEAGLFEVRNAAGVWHGTQVPAPPGVSGRSKDHRIMGLSCTSATFCVAVGYYEAPNSWDQAAVSVWNGRSWTSTGSPVPKNLSTVYKASGLSSVSCATPKYCVAVGHYYLGDGGIIHPLLATWNGAQWSAFSPALPSGATRLHGSDDWSSISCPLPSNCTAVGVFTGDGGSAQAMMARQNGGAWVTSSQGIFPTQSSPLGSLTAVTCLSSNSCLAIGKTRFAHLSDVQVAITLKGTVATSTTHVVASGKTTVANVRASGIGPTTISLVKGTPHGTLVLQSNGRFTYHPKAGFFGIDSFTFFATSAGGRSGVATESLSVRPYAPPVAQAFQVGTRNLPLFNGTPLGAAGFGPLRYQIVPTTTAGTFA
ncbi:MAG: Ig-like domain-containing protein, partial [Actinomycetota bacterium]